MTPEAGSAAIRQDSFPDAFLRPTCEVKDRVYQPWSTGLLELLSISERYGIHTAVIGSLGVASARDEEWFPRSEGSTEYREHGPSDVDFFVCGPSDAREVMRNECMRLSRELGFTFDLCGGHAAQVGFTKQLDPFLNLGPKQLPLNKNLFAVVKAPNGLPILHPDVYLAMILAGNVFIGPKLKQRIQDLQTAPKDFDRIDPSLLEVFDEYAVKLWMYKPYSQIKRVVQEYVHVRRRTNPGGTLSALYNYIKSRPELHKRVQKYFQREEGG